MKKTTKGIRKIMEYYDELKALFESEDGVLFKPKPKRNIQTSDDRLLEAFNKINDFIRNNEQLPNSQSSDTNEAVLGIKLDTIKVDDKKSEYLREFDEFGILEFEKAPDSLEELFNSSGDIFDRNGIFDTSNLPRAKITDKNVGEIAKRKRVDNFTEFKDIFDDANNKLATKEKTLKRFNSVTDIRLHGLYVVDGMMCYVESIGEAKEVFGRKKERLRVIYANGVESNVYLRTLASQLYEDGGYMVVDRDCNEDVDISEKTVGHIYILESLSEDSNITTIKDLYKIGVTTGSVSNRIKNARKDPTYLMAPVKIVEDFRLTGSYNPQKVEALIHRVFAEAKIDMTIIDDKGNPYTPNEWYSIPLKVIVEAIDMINDEKISEYYYDSDSQTMVRRD